MDAEPSSNLQAQRSIQSAQTITFVAIALFVLALGITAIRAIKHADSQYIGLGASVSADVVTTARTFATEGVSKLHGVPVNNNPPIGPYDSHTLAPTSAILLSACFRIFGASEPTAHIFMLCILLATASLIFRLGSLWLGPIGGALAGYFWLTLSVVIQFGDLVAQQSLAMLFVVAALVAFSSSRERSGAVLLFLAVLSSWESALVLAGIWFAARKLPDLRRTAIMATYAVAAAILCLMVLFIVEPKTGSRHASDHKVLHGHVVGILPPHPIERPRCNPLLPTNSLPHRQSSLHAWAPRTHSRRHTSAAKANKRPLSYLILGRSLDHLDRRDANSHCLAQL